MAMKELLPFIRLLWPQRLWVFWAVVLGILTLLSSIGLLALSGWFLSATAVAGLSLATARDFNLSHPNAGIRAFAVGRTVGRYLERVISHEATLRLLSSLRVWFYRRIEPQAPASLYRHRSGDLLSRIVTDIDTLDALFIRVLSPTLVALFITAVVGGFLWWLAPSLAVVFLLFFIMAGLLVPLLTQRLGRRVGSQIQRQLAQLRMNLVEDIAGVADLTVYGAQHRHCERRLAESDGLLRLQEKMARISAFSAAIMTLLSGLAAVTALYVAIPIAAQPERFDGALLALITFGILSAFEAILPLPQVYQMLGRIRSAAQRLLEVSESPVTVRFPAVPAITPLTVDIRFEAVGFAYPERVENRVLDWIDLALPAGSTMALVGPSGCGKTTLAHLLTRFWDPDRGRVLIGGTDLRQFAEVQLRQMVTLVSQQSHLFNATLRENLLIADPEADEAVLWDALERAQLASFVTGLPEGLETWTGEAGSHLSGGEARRLILARALLKNAPIWILDEPTEGLDPQTRKRFNETLFENLAGKSALLITHSRDALERVDRVGFIENGRVIACGRHKELLEDCERYRHFIHTQPTA
jgi:ATP-binding cassette, subfamily C, bacterial CydC